MSKGNDILTLIFSKKRYLFMKDLKIGTRCLHAGYTPGNGEPRQMPIYQSTTFKYDDSDEMGKLFDLEASGYFYTRLQNPTNGLRRAFYIDSLRYRCP